MNNSRITFKKNSGDRSTAYFSSDGNYMIFSWGLDYAGKPAETPWDITCIKPGYKQVEVCKTKTLNEAKTIVKSLIKCSAVIKSEKLA